MLCPLVHLYAFIVRRLIRALHDLILSQAFREFMVNASCSLNFRCSYRMGPVECLAVHMTLAAYAPA